MSHLNCDGTIDSDKVYTDRQLCLILHITPDQLAGYFKLGLRSWKPTREQPRQVSGAEYHRFVERMSVPCPDVEDVKA